MNDDLSLFQTIDTLIKQKILFDKPEETLDTITLADKSVFVDLQDYLSKLTVKDNEVFTSETDYLSLLTLFLLENIPLEIDLNLLTSTETGFLHIQATAKKIYKPNLFSAKHEIPQYKLESQEILHELFHLFQVNNLEEFLRLKQHQDPLYLHCIRRLKPFLSKTNYDKYPIAIKLFVQVIKSMDQLSLSESFDLLFPVCLITLDDPSMDKKLIALYIIEHLQKHCTNTDLLLFNRADVIMYGLEQNLHHRGDRIILFECLLATAYRWLILLENEVYSGKHLFIRTSQLIDRFIRDALLEVNAEHHRALIKILRQYVNRLELFAVRHLNHLIKLIEDSIDNKVLRYESLQLLLTVIQKLTPRINNHRYDIMRIIIRCLFRIIHEDKENTSMVNLHKKCLTEFHLLVTDNYVQDSIQLLINTPQLDVIYREGLSKLLGSLQTKETTD